MTTDILPAQDTLIVPAEQFHNAVRELLAAHENHDPATRVAEILCELGIMSDGHKPHSAIAAGLKARQKNAS